MSLKLKLKTEIRHLVKPSWRFVSQFFWRKQLSRKDSIEFLKEAIIYEHLSPPVPIPVIESANGIIVKNFQENENNIRILENDYVWKINLNDTLKSLRVCRCGVPLINNNLLLDLDFGSYAGLLEFTSRVEVIKYPLVVAPWHNYPGTYWDFVICTLAKLCRIEEALGRDIWKKAKVCYPLIHTHFESQFLEKMGISKDSIIDTRSSHVEVQAESLVLANSQPDFVYPSPRDLMLVRNRFLEERKRNIQNKNRIYVSRGNRRRVKNEAEVISLLKKYDFKIIKDVQRSVDEQISLFHESSVIVTPHGASLANLVWCDPGTVVIELFSDSYTPLYYYYICQVMGLDYSYIVEKTNLPEDWSNAARDMNVDINALKQELERRFS